MFRFGKRYSDDLRKKSSSHRMADDHFDDRFDDRDDDRYEDRYDEDDRFDDTRDMTGSDEDDRFDDTRDMTENDEDDRFYDTREMNTYGPEDDKKYVNIDTDDDDAYEDGDLDEDHIDDTQDMTEDSNTVSDDTQDMTEDSDLISEDTQDMTEDSDLISEDTQDMADGDEDERFDDTREMDAYSQDDNDSFDDTSEMDTYCSDDDRKHANIDTDDDEYDDERFDDTRSMNDGWGRVDSREYDAEDNEEYDAEDRAEDRVKDSRKYGREDSKKSGREDSRGSRDSRRSDSSDRRSKDSKKNDNERISAYRDEKGWDDEDDSDLDDLEGSDNGYDITYDKKSIDKLAGMSVKKSTDKSDSNDLADDDDRYEEDYEDDYEDTYWGDDNRYSNSRTGKDGHGRKARNSSRRKNSQNPAAAFFIELWYKMKHMSNMDRIVTATGALVLVVAIVTVSIFANAKSVQKQVGQFQSIGENMDGVTVIGQSGLIAVSDAESARLTEMTDASTEMSTEESTEESSEASSIAVRLKVTSIKDDLKLKFINRESGKLVAGVAFKAKASGPEEIELVDDDKDGIIYKKDVKAGTYKIKVETLPDDIKDKYTFSEDTAECTVSDQIEYKKVDVKDEVKTEKQVNAAKEDTKTTNDTPVESQLTDTVEWVESSKVGTDGSSAEGYVEVNKTDVPDPGNVSKISFYRADLVSTQVLEDTALSGSTSGTTSVVTTTPSATTPSTTTPSATTPSTTTPSTTTPSTTTPSTTTPTTTTTTTTKTDTSSTKTDTSKKNQTLTLSPASVNLIKGKTAVVTPELEGASDTTLNWTVSDSKIATVSAASTSGGGTVTITAISAGTAVVTAVLKENTAVTAKLTVTVTAGDPTAKLKDKDGHQLYILVNGKYVEATYADYAKYDKFYRKSDNSSWIYTGWQTIDGATYFYTKDHNFVTGDQIIQGVKYTFGSDGHLQAGSGKLGIDVSKWNGAIDWNAVRNSGVSYAIIRCGYRGKSGGSLIQDPRFSANVQGARAAGLSVGLYFFSQATSDVEAVEEASMAVNMASGCGLSLPIYIDVEGSGGRGDSIDTGTRTAVCKAFCATVRNSGYAAGVYSNKSWLTSRINTGSLTGYKIWLAQYAAQPTYTATRYDMWQYSSKGRIAGINGNVDMNLRFN